MVDLPVVDVSALRPLASTSARDAVVRALDVACRDTGFFYVVGHGVDDGLQQRLDDLARAFFALPAEEKAQIAMEHGGRAWRGWFPLGGELTSGRPDRKEGLYFGAELDDQHPRVRAGIPLHGVNLFPTQPRLLRGAVLTYIAALTDLGHLLAEGLGRALGLDADWFATHLTADPTVLFRIFHYPPADGRAAADGWGVAEHTDYGLLTMVRQDAVGGLEVRTPHGWISAPPVPGSFVCNLGDMLERMTGGVYRSTPHRVRNTGETGRISFAFFFDPSWEAEIVPISAATASSAIASSEPRWDGANVHEFRGTLWRLPPGQGVEGVPPARRPGPRQLIDHRGRRYFVGAPQHRAVCWRDDRWHRGCVLRQPLGPGLRPAVQPARPDARGRSVDGSGR